MQQERKDRLASLIERLTAIKTELSDGLAAEASSMLNEIDSTHPDYNVVDAADMAFDAAVDSINDAIDELNNVLTYTDDEPVPAPANEPVPVTDEWYEDGDFDDDPCSGCDEDSCAACPRPDIL